MYCISTGMPQGTELCLQKVENNCTRVNQKDQRRWKRAITLQKRRMKYVELLKG